MSASANGSGPQTSKSRASASQVSSAPDGWWVGLERLSPEQIRAVYDGQDVNAAEDARDRNVVSLQLFVALALILGGAMLATVGILLIKESDSTKLTAIISLCTAVIGAGAALLPTGAVAGATARILTRPPTGTNPGVAPPFNAPAVTSVSTNGGRAGA